MWGVYMLDKKMLVVINPCAGQKRANRYLTDILGIFSSGLFALSLFPQAARQKTEAVKTNKSNMQINFFFIFLRPSGNMFI